MNNCRNYSFDIEKKALDFGLLLHKIPHKQSNNSTLEGQSQRRSRVKSWALLCKCRRSWKTL